MDRERRNASRFRKEGFGAAVEGRPGARDRRNDRRLWPGSSWFCKKSARLRKGFVMRQLGGEQRIPPSFSDRCKRAFLGRPMITYQLEHERLSNPVALGVLSPDAISSTAYGSEQVMIELLPAAGMAAFALLLPITGVILLILVLVAASYRQVVMVYTRAGGSYVVARENFGPKIAQVAAASLLIDYVVTVAVQCAAGTVAVASAFPVLGPYSLEITVAVVLVMCFANLRGLREAGARFAFPTYFFVGMVSMTIIVGIIREISGDLKTYNPEHIAERFR